MGLQIVMPSAMTESTRTSVPGDPTEGDRSSEANLVNIVYILYLASLIFGITALIAVVMAYVNERDAPGCLWSHYNFQIRTFWIGLFYLVIGVATAYIIVGIFVILFWVIWLIVRCARGMKYLARGEPHPDPMSWLFG